MVKFFVYPGLVRGYSYNRSRYWSIKIWGMRRQRLYTNSDCVTHEDYIRSIYNNEISELICKCFKYITLKCRAIYFLMTTQHISLHRSVNVFACGWQIRVIIEQFTDFNIHCCPKIRLRGWQKASHCTLVL